MIDAIAFSQVEDRTFANEKKKKKNMNNQIRIDCEILGSKCFNLIRFSWTEFAYNVGLFTLDFKSKQ